MKYRDKRSIREKRKAMSQHVLITGGASGLGRALAERYLRSGAQVLIADRDAARGEATCQALQPLATRHGGSVHFQPADICRDEDWQALLCWCQTHWQGLDVLINNAGVAAGGRIEKLPMADWDWIIEINLKGMVRGLREFVPLLKQQGHGQIINIASLAALANAPMMSSYNVTKAAVVSLSETLRHELGAYGIAVSVVCPSFFQTNLADSLRSPEPGLEQSVRKLLASGKLDAAQVANYIFRAAQKKRFLILPHAEGRWLWRLKRFVPVVYNRTLGNMGRSVRRKLDRTDHAA